MENRGGNGANSRHNNLGFAAMRNGMLQSRESLGFVTGWVDKWEILLL